MGNQKLTGNTAGHSSPDSLLGNINARANSGEETPTYVPITTGLIPYTGPFGRPELLHLLKRTMFGVTRADLDYFSGKSLNTVVTALLSNFPVTLPSTPLNDYESIQDEISPDPAHIPTVDWMGVPQGQTWVNNPCNRIIISADGTKKDIFAVTKDNSKREQSIKKWNMGLAVTQSKTAYEKLVLFWHNHFPVSIIHMRNAQRIYLYIKLIRENVNTGLKDMCIKITKDTAMLKYLNGEVSTNKAPDENYARELQELFTIGKEIPADKRYTEADVKAAAAVLTGHDMISANSFEAVYGFNPNNHVTGNKTFSAFYSNTVITGSATATATSGEDELNQLMNMIFNDTDKAIPTLAGTPFSAWSRADIIADYIVKKVYRFFVYYDIDDSIKTKVIKPLADIYKANDFKILPVLQALFTSQHFFDMENRGCHIKMPMDLVVGLLRTTKVYLKDADVVKQYQIYNSIFEQCDDMLQGYLQPPNIAGWAAYYQAPQYHQLWINSDTLPKRQSFSQSFCGNKPKGTFRQFPIKLDHIAFCKTLTNPSDPNALIDEMSELLLGIPLSSTHKAKIKTDILLNKQTDDAYWSIAWNLAIAPTATKTEINTVITPLRNLMDYMVRLEEFQLI